MIRNRAEELANPWKRYIASGAASAREFIDGSIN